MAETGYEQQEGWGGKPSHVWWIKDERGAVHIWARVSHLTGYPSEWIGGVECHWANCPESSGWFDPSSPSQTECWLLKGPCWHDGSSLYFRERIALFFPHPESDYRNDPERFPVALIEHELRSWHADKIAASKEPAA